MGIKCLLGKHHFSLPRLTEGGKLMRECLRCMRVEYSSVRLPPDASEAVTLDERRARAITELAATGEWVGQSRNAPPPRRSAAPPRAASPPHAAAPAARREELDDEREAEVEPARAAEER
jgi:hypothetical protein